MLGRAKVLGTLLMVLTVAGCGDMWGDLWGSKRSAEGTGDGGSCTTGTKDNALLTQIILTPPACDSSNTCPCGSYCSSTITGVCVVDCRDDSECASGKTCSVWGQCVGGGSSDGGVPPNPSCPRSVPLLLNENTLKRHCNFDDICPYGSRCDQASGLCKYDCLQDSDCADAGAGAACSCLGQCVSPANPPESPSATQPTLVVTPNRFPLPAVAEPPPDGPNWGGVGTREFKVSMTSTVLLGDGATPDVTVAPGAHTEVSCSFDVDAGTGTFQSEPCTFNLGKLTRVAGTESYKTDSKTISMRAVPTMPGPDGGINAVSRWEVRVGALGVAASPAIVAAENAPGSFVPGGAEGDWQDMTATGVPASFRGKGFLKFASPLGENISIPVTGRGDTNWRLVLYDAAKMISESGKFGLHDNHSSFYGMDSTSDTNDWIAFPTNTHPNATGGIQASRISNQSVQAHVMTNGTIDSVNATFNLYFPEDFGGGKSRTIPVVVHLDAAADMAGLFCDPSTACPVGQICDLGFCGTETNTFPDQSVLSLNLKQYMLEPGGRLWDIHNQGSSGPTITAETAYCGDRHIGRSLFEPAIFRVSGEASCYFPDDPVDTDLTKSRVPTAVPLLAHGDLEATGERSKLSSAELLQACLHDLARPEPTTGNWGFNNFFDRIIWSGGPPLPDDFKLTLPNPAYLTYAADCISLGQWSTALGEASASGDQPLRDRLLQEWLEVHSFVAREGLQENEVQQTLGELPAQLSTAGTSTPNAPSVEKLITQMEVGWDWFFGSAFQYNGPGIRSTDYRISGYLDTAFGACNDSLPCSVGRYCDKSGTWATPDVPSGSGVCLPLRPDQAPQHEQPTGLPTAMLTAMTSHLLVANRAAGDAVMSTYAAGGSQTARQKALSAAGRALRFALWIEAAAKTMYLDLTTNDTCVTCREQAWKDHWQAASLEFMAARRTLMRLVSQLQSNANPLGFRDDDVPLFFGDVMGTNSRYFASSDYLLDGWAAPAVTAAQGSLEAARTAWIQQVNSKAQDVDAQANRERIMETLKSTYGDKILDNCGPIQQLASSQVLENISLDPNQHSNIDLNTCYIRGTCAELDDVTNNDVRKRTIDSDFDGSVAKSQLCKMEILAKIQAQQSCVAIDDGGEAPFNQPNICVPSIASLNAQTADLPSDGTTDHGQWSGTDFACFFGSTPEYKPKACAPCNGTPGACEQRSDCFYQCMSSGGRTCDPEHMDQCNDPKCLFERGKWASFKYSNGNPVEEWKLMPDNDFEAHPWRSIEVYPVTKNGVTEKWVRTTKARSRTGAVCRVPADFFYGNYPASWGSGQKLQAENSGAWALATQSCSSGSVIDWDSNHPNLDGPRYPSADHPLPMPELPADCYSGKMGLAELSIRDANLKLKEAYALINEKKGGIDDQFQSCVKLAKDVKDAEAARGFWHKWKVAIAVASLVAATVASGGLSTPALVAALAYVGTKALDNSTAMKIATLVTNTMDDQIAEIEAKLGHSMATDNCWHALRDQSRTLGDAAIQIKLAVNQIDTANAELTKLQQDNYQAALDGKGKVLAEQNRPYGSYAHDYWYDEKGERFRKDLDWARRMTYVAMEAIEYEFQQSLPFRHDILTATNPDTLADVVRALKQEQGSRSINRRRPEESSVVLSLRDDVLRVADRSAVTTLGERNWTPAQRFSGQLAQTAFAYFNNDGKYMGQAVPFNLGPQGVLETRCGERLWRVTATVQGDGLSDSAPNTSLLLLKKNTFSSQWCASSVSNRPAMQSASIYPSEQLFRPGAVAAAGDSTSFTPALLNPWFNIRKTDFYKSSYQDGASEELSGRGLYGDYVLLFPKQVLDGGFPIEKVEDVLLRIDYLSVDNLAQ